MAGVLLDSWRTLWVGGRSHTLSGSGKISLGQVFSKHLTKPLWWAMP